LERVVIEVLVGRRVKLSSSAAQPDVASLRDLTQLTDSRSQTRHDALPTSPYERRTGQSLDARAMYLAGSSIVSMAPMNRITIVQAVSSGCARMKSQDVIDLYERARVNGWVVVSDGPFTIASLGRRRFFVAKRHFRPSFPARISLRASMISAA
jgi:hypothetical protein